MIQMTLEEKVGQLLQVRVYADYTSERAAEKKYVETLIQRYHIGSLDIGGRQNGANLEKPTPEQVAAITNDFQKASKLPLLIGADLERGLASRFSGVPDFPFPMAFGAANDQKAVEREAAITAQEARAIGIHWTFGPVADLNSNPANPIINTRSFGEDAAASAPLVSAYIRGAHASEKDRLLVAVKHFPGEGDTSADPHLKVTAISATKEHLNQIELLPFQSAIQAGADSVMLAQAAVPAVDPDAQRIATTSGKLVDGVLRQQLGFQGLVITDALEMRGLTELYKDDPNPSARIAIDAIKAGDDVLTLPRDLNRTYLGILNAVAHGEIPESRIDASVRRILTVKASLGLDQNRFIDLAKVGDAFRDRKPFAFAQEVSDAAVTLVRNEDRLLPLHMAGKAEHESDASRPKVIAITLTDSKQSRLGPTFDKEFLARNPDAKIFHYYNDQIDSDVNPFELLPMLKNADKVVIAAYVVHTAPRQETQNGQTVNTVGFAGPGAKFLGQVLAVNLQKTIVVALGSPYVIDDFPQIRNYVCTYSLVSTAEISAIRALFGEINNHAKLPITLPGIAERGFALPWPQKK